MVQRKRTYKKRAYKRRYKRTYRRRGYKRRFYKPIKRPEIHITENTVNVPFNNTSIGMGQFNWLTEITEEVTTSDIDELRFKLNNKIIDGSKVRLKYLYIKGYISINGAAGDDNNWSRNFNCKLMVFRWKKNTTNSNITWGNLVNDTNGSGIDLSSPSTWTTDQCLQMLYMKDWKNDIKVNFYKKVKNLYRKYDDVNNIIPFKIRVPLYDCVLSCDSNFSSGVYSAKAQPSTNGLYFTFLSDKYGAQYNINYKYKLYYTDY